MANNENDRRELLKIRQGLTEETEINFGNETQKPSELTSFQRVENFFYYHKWTVVIALCAVALMAFLIIQTVSREKEDLRVILIATDYSAEMSSHTEALKAALERYCPDFDENGSVTVNVVYIDLAAGEDMGEYYLAQKQRYSTELFDGIAQMIITDEGIAEYFSDENGFAGDAFIDYSGQFPEEMLFEGRGIHISHTELAESSGWTDCPDSVIILIRQDQNGNTKKLEQRSRAESVLQNILDGGAN